MSVSATKCAQKGKPWRRTLRKVLARCLLGFCVLLLIAGSFVAYLTNYFLHDPKVTPRELYDRTWQTVVDNIYDKDKLTKANWDSWRHKYDKDIKTDEDAVKYCREMLKSLGDRHTFLLDKKQVVSSYSNAYQQTPLVSGRTLPDGIGYVRIEGFDRLNVDVDLEKMLQDLDSCPALIIDLRNNLGGFLHEAILASSLLIEEGKLIDLTVRVPGQEYAGMYVVLHKHFITVWIDGIAPVPIKRFANMRNGRPLVVLINGNTASAAEAFAAALAQTGNAYVIGEDSYGKGIGQTYIPVGNGTRLNITNFRTRTPNGTWLGDARDSVINPLKPNLEVKLKPPENLMKDMQASKSFTFGSTDDNQLQAAQEYLRTRMP